MAHAIHPYIFMALRILSVTLHLVTMAWFQFMHAVPPPLESVSADEERWRGFESSMKTTAILTEMIFRDALTAPSLHWQTKLNGARARADHI